MEIARSLVIEPSFLLLDEPFSGIDPIQVLELQKIIFDLKNSGIGILMTDHNVRETLAVTDRAYIINNGRIFRSGSPESLGNDAEVRRVYLGEHFSMGIESTRAPHGDDSKRYRIRGAAGLGGRALGLLAHGVCEVGDHHGHFFQRLAGRRRVKTRRSLETRCRITR